MYISADERFFGGMINNDYSQKEKGLLKMGKKKRVREAAAAQLDIAKGSGKKYEKKAEGKAGKVIGIIAGILAAILVLGAFAWYYVPGIVTANKKAVTSENYKVTAPMMTYYFNSSYQSYVSSYKDYLSYVGLDVTKSLKDQNTQDGQTWYDYFMDGTVSSVKQLLVLNEAAKADKDFDKEDEVKSFVDESVESLKSQAQSYNVTFDYYLRSVYGNGVTEKVFRNCMELSERASLYSSELASRYEYKEADWDKYYEENVDNFRKVDYLTYTFSVQATAVADDATEDEKEAAAAADKAEAARLKVVADGLAAAKTEEEFYDFVENYLRTDKYKDMDDAALEADNVDIDALVTGCLKEGTSYSESELGKWLFEDARKGFETKIEESEDGNSVTVSMILPAEDSDIGSACLYRDTYTLKSYRYIPALIEEMSTDDAAKTYIEDVKKQFDDDATEDNFAALAAEDKYGDGNYEGGLVEDADKGVLCDEVDEWLNDSARKAGDCDIIHSDAKGYYLVYFVGDGMQKWQASANSSLIGNAYDAEYAELEKQYSENFKTDDAACRLVKEVDLSGAAETTAA